MLYWDTRIIYEKRPRKNVNGRSSEAQVKTNYTPCCLCGVGTAPAEKELIVLPSGKKAHYILCVLPRVFAKLAEAGLPRPTRYSSPHNLRDYLNKQTRALLSQPFNKVRDKLEVITELSEVIFGKPVNISMVRQSSEDTTFSLGNFA